MKRLLLILAIPVFAAEGSKTATEPTTKERLQAIQILELKMEVAKANWSEAVRTQNDAQKSFVEAQSASTAGKLSACVAVGGAKIEDCDFDFTAFTVKRKPEKPK